MEEQLGDGEGRSGRLLRKQRLDVLSAVRRTRVAVRESGDGDVGLAPRCDSSSAGKTRNQELLIGRALGLCPVDQLHELGRALEVAEERLGLTLGRIAAQSEEA